MFCKHDWKLLSKEITESKFEHAMKQVRKNGNGHVGNVTVPPQMCCAERKLIQVFACKKCGKIKKFVDTI